MTWLTTDEYLASIERDAAVMLDVLADTPLDAPVPSCPDWVLRDLITHTGIVHRHKAETVRGGWVDESPPPPRAPEEDLRTWFADGVADLLVVLSTADLTNPAWTWCNHEHSARWWLRRMAHETAIHAADAILTAGGTPGLDERLATDGVDEILIEMMVGGPSWGTVTPGDRVVAIELDSQERWVLRSASFSGTSPTSGRTYEALDTFLLDDAPADTTISADASTIDLWLWGRGPLDGGFVIGDPDLAAHVRSVAAESTG
jgi:uncharacterized protein (TIGR03083 family)